MQRGGVHNLVVNKVRAFGFTPCARPPGAAAGSSGSAREYVRQNLTSVLFSLRAVPVARPPGDATSDPLALPGRVAVVLY